MPVPDGWDSGEGALRGGEGADNILFKIVGHKGNLFLATGE